MRNYYLQDVTSSVALRSKSKVIDTLPSCFLASSSHAENDVIITPPSGNVVTVVHTKHSSSSLTQENKRIVQINNNVFTF